MSGAVVTGAQAGLVSCETCKLLSRPVHLDEPGHCPRCGAALELRRVQSLQRTWALIIAAAAHKGAPAPEIARVAAAALRSGRGSAGMASRSFSH